MTRPTPLWLLVGLQGGISAASLVVEIVAGRMLAPHVGMSLYTWTAVIAVVLAGFSAGHWWGGRLAEKPAATALAWTGGATLAAALTTAAAVLILPMVAGPVLSVVTSPVWGITVLTAVVFFLPSFFAGVPAPVLAQIAVDTADRSGPALGAMFASGAVGAIAGTLLAGFVFIAWLGSALTLVVVTLVYIGSGLLFFWLARSGGLVLALTAAALAAGMAGLALAAPAQCHQETRYFCLRVDDLSAELGRNLRFGSPDQRDLTALQTSGDAVDGRACGSQSLDLLRGLHRSNRTRDGGRPAKLGCGLLPHQIDQKPAPHVVTDGGFGRIAHEPRDQCNRILRLGPWLDREHVGALGDPRRFECGHHERRRGVTRHDEHRDAFERHRLVSGEVGQVGTHGEQQDVDTVDLHALTGPLESLGEHEAEARPDGAASDDDQLRCRWRRRRQSGPACATRSPFRRRPHSYGRSPSPRAAQCRPPRGFAVAPRGRPRFQDQRSR